MFEKTILVIAGTQDARQIIAELQQLNQLVIHATVATELGREFLQSYPNLQIHSGRLDLQGLATLIQNIAAVAVIDASHPYATEISQNAMGACRETGIPYLRYEREQTSDLVGNIVLTPDFATAAAEVASMKGHIFLAIGSNHLEVFTSNIADYQERLYVRVLPESRVIQKCENLGLRAGNILAIQGPFSEALNREMYQYCKAAVVVTKDSGVIGGNREKLAAAAQLNLPVLMIARPRINYETKTLSINEIIEFGKELAN